MKTAEVYSDRFIPSRSGSQVDLGFPLMDEDPQMAGNTQNSPTQEGNSNGNQGQGGQSNASSNQGGNDSQREGHSTYSMLLRTELLGVPHSPMGGVGSAGSPNAFATGGGGGAQANGVAGRPSSAGSRHVAPNTGNLFKFKKPRMHAFQELLDKPTLSPVGSVSARLLASPRKAKRKIAKVPFKVLDAPSLQDDFYLNLVDWSSQNVLAVGLGSCVYLWSACTSKVTKLCDLGADEGAITSVSWTHRGSHVAVGTNNGDVQIWDVSKCKKTRSMDGHTARVGTMAWNAHLLASGSRDRLIFLRDVRAPTPHVHKLQGHKQEVCGLRWSFDDSQLASGGNDNKLLIWDASGATSPVMKFNDHTAAVKAIAWSPHQHGLLASGGGTADRCIRFRNTLTGTALNCIDTGSQVCNLMWSKNVNEIVSTHGYSLNQIIVWRYPSMTKVSTLTGHTYRVLYLAMSPDGQTIVTGAGDETLRFWNVFPGPKNKDGSRLGTSLLFPSYPDIR
jgi:cell division cycle 20-like protein 1 (cofactor of APC complex)